VEASYKRERKEEEEVASLLTFLSLLVVDPIYLMKPNFIMLKRI